MTDRDTAMEAARQMVTLPNGLKIELCGVFKLVYQQELFEIAGPVKGHTGEDRRAAQLIREAWNKLPLTPSLGGALPAPSGSAAAPQARALAIEEAAKVVDEFDNPTNVGHPGLVSAIARSIRSLASPPRKAQP